MWKDTHFGNCVIFPKQSKVYLEKEFQILNYYLIDPTFHS